MNKEQMMNEYARLCAELGNLFANKSKIERGINDLTTRILDLDVNYQALVNQDGKASATEEVKP